MTTQTFGRSDLSWLLDNFIDKATGTAHAVVVSADGLPMAATTGLPRDRSEQLAAIVSGLASLTVGAAMCFNAGAVRQTLVEMSEGFLLVMAVGEGSHLAVLAAQGADLGQVGYEMALLVDRVGTALTPALRT